MSPKAKANLSKYDILWLQELYKAIDTNERTSYRILRARLHKELPVNYNPEKIDTRFARFRGEDITIEGVDAIDPKFNVIDKANNVMLAVKNLLLQNPEKEEVKAMEIAQLTKLSEKDVSIVLRLVSQYGRFWNNATGSQEYPYGYSSIRIQNDNQIFDEYMYFTDIRDLIKKKREETENERKYSRNPYLSEDEADEEEYKARLTPIFKSKIDRVDPKLCFVLMPFKKEWSDEVFKLIKNTIESIGFQCVRADNLNGPIIIEDIWIKINQAGIIIADVTDKNPNVMYEVGIAHTVGRPTILLTQNAKKIPFDFAHLRHIEYRNSIDGREVFESRLREVIAEMTKGSNTKESKVVSKIISGTIGRKLLKGLR